MSGAVPVGMEPVAVAVRPDGSQAWVVNHLSDSVSIVDLTAVQLSNCGGECRESVYSNVLRNTSEVFKAKF